MNCKECSYFWYDYDDEGNCISAHPYCHWESRCPGDVAPCEEDEYEEYDEDISVYEYEEYDEDIPEYEEDWDE